MKIRAQAHAAPSWPDSTRTRPTPRAERSGRADANPAPGTDAASAATSASEGHPRGGKGPKAAPPGLERVFARLQAMDEGQRTAGPSNAMDRIGRNLARYLETQGLATPVPAQPVADAAIVEAVADADVGATSDAAPSPGNTPATAGATQDPVTASTPPAEEPATTPAPSAAA